MNIRLYYPELCGIILCLSLGMAVGFSVSDGFSSWYLHLYKPIFTAPSWIYGPIWSILYILIGIALGRIYKLNSKNLLLLFASHFILNLAWPILFFHFHRVDIALVDITLILASLVMLILGCKRHSAKIVFILIPYLLWIYFAWILNYKIYLLN